MKEKILLCLWLLLFLFMLKTRAQENRTIFGTVLSEAHTPLSGVSIRESGSDHSMISDDNGKFALAISTKNVLLIISSIGYITQRIAIGNRDSITIILVKGNKKLQEVVVVGYGTQRRSDLTGSISVVKGDDLRKISNQRVDQALQGRVPGMYVRNTDGAPGGTTKIRIRGTSSILGGNEALVVIDGMQGGNLSKINPAVIQSVQILKGASATAIYGSRGANGVILITTKKGQAGKPLIDYSMNVGVQQISHWLDLLNAAQYARIVNDYRALGNSGGNIPTPVFTEEQIENFEKNGGVDWQKAIYRKAVIHNQQLSISGGTDKVKYFLSGSYLNQQGILINSGYKRYSLRSNVEFEINNWLSGGLNLYTIRDRGKSPAFGGETGQDISLTGAALIAPLWGAVNPIYNPDGTYFRHPATFGPKDTWNPVASAREVSPLVKSMNNNASLSFNIDLLEGLSLNLSGYANIINTDDSKFYNEKTKEGLPVNGKAGLGYQDISEWEYYQTTANVTYEKTLGKHHFKITAVAEQSSSDYQLQHIEAKRFTSTANGLKDLASADEVINSSSASKNTLISYLGRINYTFLDKYLLTLTYRADGSSVFGINNQWGFFPSAAFAWKLSEEKFIDKLNFISTLKLRTGIGLTGNQAIDPYQALATVSSGFNYPWNGGSSTNIGFGITNPPNPDLKWESTRQIDLGIDLGLFDDRITATVDIYRKKTTNLLLYRQLASSSGYSAIIDNIGSTQNKGLEIELSGYPIKGNLQWQSGFNISLNRSKVISLGDTKRLTYIVSMGGYNLNTPLMWLVPGEPFGQMYGWGYLGTWSIKDAKLAKEYGQLPGDPRYEDANKDGKIDLDDLQVIGNAYPDFVFGWSNSLKYKNFELGFLIQGVYGNDVFNQTEINLEAPWEANSAKILNRWTPDNQDTDVPAYIDDATREAAGLTSKIYDMDNRTGRWVEDGSYIRLKSLTLGYTLGGNLLKSIGIVNLRVYLRANNLFTITNYSGYNPEVSSYNESDALLGVDLGNYPPSRTLSFGVSCSLK